MTKNKLKQLTKLTLWKALQEAYTHIEHGPEIFSPEFMINKVSGKTVQEVNNEPKTQQTSTKSPRANL